MKVSYSKAGVDIKKAELFVKGIGVHKSTTVRAFGSIFDLTPYIKNDKQIFLVSSCDGVGTKIKIAQLLNKHYPIGIDLVAMNVNDVICLGALPLFFLDYIACGKINISILNSIIRGIKYGLKEANAFLIGGETAEMPGVYKEDEYDLAGFCVGYVKKDNFIDGTRIDKNDLIIGVSSSGLHSNGFSLVRKVFTEQAIYQYKNELLKPTRIYVPLIQELIRSKLINHIKGVAHITGGSFYNKATKILPTDRGMVIYKKNWPIPKIFKIIQQKGDILEKEMFTVFNMGIGLMLVVGNRYSDAVLKVANRFWKSWVIGEIITSSNPIVIV